MKYIIALLLTINGAFSAECYDLSHHIPNKIITINQETLLKDGQNFKKLYSFPKCFILATSLLQYKTERMLHLLLKKPEPWTGFVWNSRNFHQTTIANNLLAICVLAGIDVPEEIWSFFESNDKTKIWIMNDIYNISILNRIMKSELVKDDVVNKALENIQTLLDFKEHEISWPTTISKISSLSNFWQNYKAYFLEPTAFGITKNHPKYRLIKYIGQQVELYQKKVIPSHISLVELKEQAKRRYDLLRKQFVQTETEIKNLKFLLDHNTVENFYLRSLVIINNQIKYYMERSMISIAVFISPIIDPKILEHINILNSEIDKYLENMQQRKIIICKTPKPSFSEFSNEPEENQFLKRTKSIHDFSELQK